MGIRSNLLGLEQKRAKLVQIPSYSLLVFEVAPREGTGLPDGTSRVEGLWQRRGTFAAHGCCRRWPFPMCCGTDWCEEDGSTTCAVGLPCWRSLRPPLCEKPGQKMRKVRKGSCPAWPGGSVNNLSALLRAAGVSLLPLLYTWTVWYPLKGQLWGQCVYSENYF